MSSTVQYAAFMDLEKAFDKLEWTAMWDVLKVYGVDGRMLKGVKAFYKNGKACIRVGEEMSENFGIQEGVRQGYVMTPWLFNLYKDGDVKVKKAEVGDVGVKVSVKGDSWVLNTILFADDTVLIAKDESGLQTMVDVFGTV